MKEKYLIFITAIVSICVTYYNIEIVKLNNEQSLNLSKIHVNHDWKYKLTEFMGKHKEDIFSDDLETRENIQKIMMVSFPENITSKLFKDLSQISNHNDWRKVIDILKRINQPTVFIQIVKGFPALILEAIPDTIACGDISYVTDDEYVHKSLTSGDVRYFYKEDKHLAQTILNDFTELACSEGYKLDLKLFPLTKNKDRNIQGTIEVWLSPKSVKKITNKKLNCYLEEESLMLKKL